MTAPFSFASPLAIILGIIALVLVAKFIVGLIKKVLIIVIVLAVIAFLIYNKTLPF